MKRTATSRRRPSVHITLARAARLHRLVMFLAAGPRTRDHVLGQLAVGLRTFYRELELLKRCGVKVQHKDKSYVLHGTPEQAEGRLPFPDPQLSFAEMAELAQGTGEAAQRLAELLRSVTEQPDAPAKPNKSRGGKKAKLKGTG